MTLNPNANLPKRGTATQWTTANPVLGVGELGYETDTKLSKRGDGTSAWTALTYQGGGTAGFVDRGNAAYSTTYNPNDMVLYNGQRVLITTAVTTASGTNGIGTPFISGSKYIKLTSRGWFWAADYGVTADGVTDDWPALQNLLILLRSLSANSFSGWRVILPSGTIAVSKTVIVPTQCTLVGQGLYSTAIKLLPNSNCDVLQPEQFNSAYQAGLLTTLQSTLTAGNLRNAFRWQLCDLTVHGNSGAQAATDYHHGVNAQTNPLTTPGTGDPDFDPAALLSNIQFRSCTGDGFFAAGRSAARLVSCIAWFNLGNGISPSFDTQMVACQAGFNGMAGFYFSHGSNQGGANKSYNNGQQVPLWITGQNWVINARAYYSGVVYAAINALTAATATPDTDPTNWSVVTTTDVAAWGVGVYFNANAAEVTFDCDCQENSASNWYVKTVTNRAIRIFGCSAAPNFNNWGAAWGTVAAVFATNPNNYAGVSLDGCQGVLVNVAVNLVGTAGAHLRIVNGATKNDVVLAGDTSGALLTGDSTAILGSGNGVRYNGVDYSAASAATLSAITAALPTALPPNGAAGGGLGGTYPNPSVTTVAAGVSGPLSATDTTTTNARTPTVHAASHAPAGSDDLTTALSAVAVPIALGTAAVGTGTGFSRQGHVHPTTGLTTILVPTALKTAPYTAAAGDLALMNVAGGATTLTLPTGAANKTQVGYIAISASITAPLTITPAAGDTLGTAGVTTASVPLAGETNVFQYDAPNTRWLSVANVKTIAALDVRYSGRTTQLVSAPVLGEYSVIGSLSNGTDTGVNTLAKHVLPAGVAADQMRLRLTNSGAASNGEADASNAATVVASVGLTTTGPWFAVRARGSRSMALDAGADIETDPIMMHVAAGGTFYSKTFFSVAAAGTWFQQPPIGVIGTDFWCSQSNGEADLSLSTAAFTPVTGTRPVAPIVVLDQQPSNRAKVAAIGDSIVGGLGDASGGSNTGFAVRALQGVLPFVKIGVSGSRIKGLVDTNGVGRRRLAAIRGCNVATILYGSNDIYVDLATLATLQGYHVLLWSILQNMGVTKLYENTIPPNTTSTDVWVTTTNQTIKTGETVRVAWNNWVRAGMPLLAGVATTSGTTGAVYAGQAGHPALGYFETADPCETARDSGLWKVNGSAGYATPDGTHPTTAFHIAMAAVVTPATFAAAASA